MRWISMFLDDFSSLHEIWQHKHLWPSGYTADTIFKLISWSLASFKSTAISFPFPDSNYSCKITLLWLSNYLVLIFLIGIIPNFPPPTPHNGFVLSFFLFFAIMNHHYLLISTQGSHLEWSSEERYCSFRNLPPARGKWMQNWYFLAFKSFYQKSLII